MSLPILYSFRRCPYAMRARMGLKLAGIDWEHREVDLKNKPQAMLDISPKGTVPVLLPEDGRVLEESLDIVLWALDQTGKAGVHSSEREKMLGLIHENDTDFKSNLDRYKYPSRFSDVMDSDYHKDKAVRFLKSLDEQLKQHKYLFGDELTFTDIAIFPFIRQFSKVNEAWFTSLPLFALKKWLSEQLESKLFLSVMEKREMWKS
jgi:glutathione S-transferase